MECCETEEVSFKLRPEYLKKQNKENLGESISKTASTKALNWEKLGSV